MESYKVLSEKFANKAFAEGKDARQITVERWTAQPPHSAAIEVTTKAEALRLADELRGTWKHRRRGAYRVVPPARRQAPSARLIRDRDGAPSRRLDYRRRKPRPWTLVTSVAAQTRNAYRDILAACFDYAVRQRWLDGNPLAVVKRTSSRHERERVLRRDDFYDPNEVDRLLSCVPGLFEEAFWLCGAPTPA